MTETPAAEPTPKPDPDPRPENPIVGFVKSIFWPDPDPPWMLVPPGVDAAGMRRVLELQARGGATSLPPPPPPSSGGLAAHLVPPWGPAPGAPTVGLNRGAVIAVDDVPVWVRWGTFSSRSPWHRVAAVRRDGPWLVLLHDDDHERWVPDHLVRGDVEVVRSKVEPAG